MFVLKENRKYYDVVKVTGDPIIPWGDAEDVHIDLKNTEKKLLITRIVMPKTMYESGELKFLAKKQGDKKEKDFDVKELPFIPSFESEDKVEWINENMGTSRGNNFKKMHLLFDGELELRDPCGIDDRIYVNRYEKGICVSTEFRS